MKIEAKDIQHWLSGEIFRSERVKQQYPLIGLILALVFVYILGGYNSDRQQRQLSDIKREVRDLKYEYLTIRAQLVDMTRPSAVAAELKERGSQLKENQEPVIYVR